MNGGIFKDWLDLRMGLEKRRILLLAHNVSSHMRPPVALWNVRLEFLPKNTTSMLQPLDQGIIVCVKRSFTRIKIEDSVDRYVAGHPQQIISIRTAEDWASRAWNDVTPTIIGNCWVHSGIFPRPDVPMSMRQIFCY
ncbi:Tigger transposable element derived 4 [Phytophthora megakarya]|uniref:Tigger transposable element derived 4 n=1 Tax=Phytophthora megakarya TaxID=4795 RepID=A0A225VU53_9STRA|nr:Tigger transposable element derived 4 [Phytophthora megakarya]